LLHPCAHRASPGPNRGKEAALKKARDELVVIGSAKDGYVSVQGATASGWV